jgi:hypothetical protein
MAIPTKKPEVSDKNPAERMIQYYVCTRIASAANSQGKQAKQPAKK